MSKKTKASYPGVDQEISLDDRVIDKLYIEEGKHFVWFYIQDSLIDLLI